MSCAPVIKWPGGKRQMIGVLKENMPEEYTRYIEPFVGGGALFFNLAPRSSLIADVNPELVNLYTQIRDDPGQIVELLSGMKNTKEFFYKTRALSSDGFSGIAGLTPAQRAARLIYLSKTCFNGLYRTNKNGEFNSPYGYYKKSFEVDPKDILSASRALQGVLIVQGSFRDVLLKRCRKGNFVFLDPPYAAISKTSNFVGYSKEGFAEPMQKDLADVCRVLDNRGVKWMQTNSNSPVIRDLYSQYDIQLVKTRRSINSNGSKRVGEDLIIKNY